MKKPFLFLFILNTAFLSFSQAVRGSYYDFLNQTESMPVKPNPSTLIIYRPENKEPLNEIRCFLKIEDDKGNDVTYDSSICTATYEWVNWRSDLTYITKIDATYFTSIFQRPYQGTVKNYQHTYYLSGGMATHQKIKKGKYKITVFTKVKDQNMFIYSTKEKPFDWISNTFEYDTENPTNVIFVSPLFTNNGFYKGGWKIDYLAPKYW